MRLRGAFTLLLLAVAQVLELSLGVHAQSLFSCVPRRPGQPIGLQALANGPGTLELRWQAPPLDRACVGGWKLLIFARGEPAASAKSFFTLVPAATINALPAGQIYTVEVQAVSSHNLPPSPPARLTGVQVPAGMGASTTAAAAATTTTTPTAAATRSAGWACVAEEAYPLCSAGTSGMCAPITCPEMARLGRCAEPYMRLVNWDTRTIRQRCASACGGCPAPGGSVPAPPLRSSLAHLQRPPADYCCAFGVGQYYAGAGGAAVAAADF